MTKPVRIVILIIAAITILVGIYAVITKGAEFENFLGIFFGACLIATIFYDFDKSKD